MTATLHMLRIEVRRNLGLWLFPLMAGLTLWLALQNGFENGSGLSGPVLLWVDVSLDIRYSAVLLGPLMGGVAAWMSTRNKRCRMDDLLSTTPRSPVVRDFATFGGTLAWGGIAYVLGAALVIVLLFSRGPWGSPHLPTILVGLFLIGAQAAGGYAMGYYVRSRFTAPFASIALWVVYLVPTQVNYAVLRNLSPVEGRYYDVFHGLVPDLSLWHAVWLLGLAGIALALMMLKHQRTVTAWSGLVITVVAAATGSMLLVHTDVREIRAQAEVIPYEPVCVNLDGGVPMCLHPAHERMLPGLTEVVEKVVGPLMGIPGGVARVEEDVDYGGIGSLDADGTLQVELYDGNNGYGYTAFTLTRVLLGDPLTADYRDANRYAQFAVQRWLFQRAGYDARGFYMGPTSGVDGEQIAAAVERIAVLDPAEQRVWLTDNLAALRASELTLEDLP